MYFVIIFLMIIGVIFLVKGAREEAMPAKALGASFLFSAFIIVIISWMTLSLIN